jgi:Asparagine synthase
MVNAGARSLKAFTISFEDRLFDESLAAGNTASRLGVEHHVVRIRNRDIVDNFLHSIWHSEIPVINCNGTAKFLLSRAASIHVKAIMTGEGADELFAGTRILARTTEQASNSAFDDSSSIGIACLDQASWFRAFSRFRVKKTSIGLELCSVARPIWGSERYSTVVSFARTSIVIFSAISHRSVRLNCSRRNFDQPWSPR